MKIGIDIDDVLCQLHFCLFNFLKEKLGSDINYRDIEKAGWFHLEDLFNLSQEKFHELLDEYCLTSGFEKILLVDGAQEGVLKLNEDHEICFITARPEWMKEKTLKFIKNNFLDTDDVFFSSEIHGDNKKKEEYCVDLGVDLIIEDNPKNSLNCAEKNIKVILIDKPWNQGVEHEKITRVNNWEEAMGKISKIEEIEND